ncbi:hypothetical protein MKX01_007769 [Papaver californicum]|nr:hypothetical protein MKX01_007769 [Papaver californicum]
MGRGSDSDSPAKGRGSFRRRSPVQRERSPARRKSSPRTRAPVRTNSSHRTRSPIREKDKSSSRGRSPRQESTRSPSPRTKRLQRAQADTEVDREREGRQYSSNREDYRGDVGDISVVKMKAAEEALEKQKPSFELSGKLAEETNRVKGVALLFTEPSDARIPDVRWRLYVFKGGEVLNEPLYIHRKTCYLFGRERRVADIPTDHPSCSKQHAVIQYRLVEKEQPDGMLKKKVGPYIMDLGSTNGTFINDNRIESQRYYELMEKDTIKFGNSSREYVVLHENSAH